MMNDVFRRWAARSSELLGSSIAFLMVFHYSDSWELFINTATTIVTFLMVFLIQNTQNRDVKALQLKLDELIRAVGGARNQLMQLELMTDEELAQLQQEFERLKAKPERRTRRPADRGADAKTTPPSE
jgi:low affinity Fe/Cu permease